MKKNRKKIIIAIFVIVLILVGIWFFVFLNKNEQKDIVGEAKNLFPFGQIELGTGGQNNQSQGTIGQGGSQETGEETSEPVEVAGPRLRRITDFPTGGFAPIVRVEDKEVTDITIDSEGNKHQTIKTIQVENNYVRYGKIEDGTIFESQLTPSKITEELLVENFIPNVEHINFSENGENALFQYWNRADRIIETYLGKIRKKEMKIKECPYGFKPVALGDEGNYVFELHQFLNKNPQTRVAVSGINSPGNEGSLAIPETITAIKNFQSLHELDIDGALGPSTKTKMLEICDRDQKRIAEEEFNKLKTRYDISGFFLPQGITGLDISPNGDDFFYLQEDNIGVVGILRKFTDNTKKTIFESPYTEWIPLWDNEESVELTTKASYQSDGYSYKLDIVDGDYHKSFKQRTGLTTLVSPDNKKIFLHEVVGDSVRNSIHSRETGKTRIINIQTFPEKCAWSHDSIKIYCAVPDALSYGNEYPDVWYQGLETYNDSLWSINTKSYRVEVVSDIATEFNQNIDVLKMGVDIGSQYLYFIDKNTEFLWSYRLEDL